MSSNQKPSLSDLLSRLFDTSSTSFNINVIYNLASLVVLSIGGVLINFLILQLRSETALGIFNQVFAPYLILSQLGVGGVQFSILKHISHVQDDVEKCADVAASALLIIISLSIPICVGMFLGADWFAAFVDSSAVGFGLKLAAPGLLFFTLNKALINIINGLNVMRAYAIFRALRFILIPVVILGIILLDYPDAYLPLSLTITELILLIVMLAYIYRYLLPIRAIRNLRYHIQSHVSYGLRGVMSGVLIEMNTRTDIMVLGYFMSDANVGIYSFVAVLVEGFAQIPYALRWTIDPVIGQHFAREEFQEVSVFAQKIRKNFVLPITLLGCAAILGYPIALTIVQTGLPIKTSWLLFSILMGGAIINARFRPFSGIFLQSGRPGIYSVIIIILVLTNLSLNVIFIQVFGLYGAAIATSIVYLLEASFMLFLPWKIFGIRL